MSKLILASVLLIFSSQLWSADCSVISRKHTLARMAFEKQDSLVRKAEGFIAHMEASENRLTDDWYDDYVTAHLVLNEDHAKREHLRDMMYYWRIQATRHCGLGKDYSHSKRIKKV